MTTTEIIDILRHFEAGNPVESRPRGSAEDYKPDPEPIWDFAGREYRKAVKAPSELWLAFDIHGKIESALDAPKDGILGLTHHRYFRCKDPEPPLRNPENIDFKKYPIPEGYRVATEEDIRANGGREACLWMFFVHGFNKWQQLPFADRAINWTYLCPIDWRPS